MLYGVDRSSPCLERVMGLQVKIAAATEVSLAHCIRESAWRGRRRLPNTWAPGQILVVKVTNAIAALAIVTGPMEDAPEIPSLPGYVRTIPVNWLWTATVPAERVKIGDWATSGLRDHSGPHYGFRIINQSPLSVEASRMFLLKLHQAEPISLRQAIQAVLPVDTVQRDLH